MIDPQEAATAAYNRGREDSAAEIARLTAALHANRCHPDYEYWFPSEPHAPGSGWEPNPEYKHKSMSGDECWRRRKEPS